MLCVMLPLAYRGFGLISARRAVECRETMRACDLCGSTAHHTNTLFAQCQRKNQYAAVLFWHSFVEHKLWQARTHQLYTLCMPLPPKSVGNGCTSPLNFSVPARSHPPNATHHRSFAHVILRSSWHAFFMCCTTNLLHASTNANNARRHWVTAIELRVIFGELEPIAHYNICAICFWFTLTSLPYGGRLSAGTCAHTRRNPNKSRWPSQRCASKYWLDTYLDKRLRLIWCVCVVSDVCVSVAVI